jgi:hypothetical protein
VAGPSAGGASYTSLALDSTNVPYVAYQDSTQGSKVTVSYYSGGTWQTVGSPGFSANWVSYVSLALDANNVPYVAYHDGGNGGKATVMRYTGVGATGWEPVGSAGFSAGDASYISLALDSSNIPYVSYQDSDNGGKATVKRYNSGSGAWETVGVAGFSAGYANYTSLALDGNNRPFVAYLDYGNSNKATVLRYPAFNRVVTYTGITASTWYTFGTGCGGVYFTSITGNIDAITLTARFGYPTAQGGGLPRRYDIVQHGGNVYQAQVALCYDDVDLDYAGIPAGQEGDLHAYQFTGSGWTPHSTVNTTTNVVTADNVTDLGQVWGLGISTNTPTAVMLQDLSVNGEPNNLVYLAALVGLALGAMLIGRRRLKVR